MYDVLIYNSRNSFGLLARRSRDVCVDTIYNSRNSFGLLASLWSYSFMLFKIYNSRNSFGLLAYIYNIKGCESNLQ